MVRISPREAADDQVPAERTVADVMTRDVDVVSPETPVHRAARMFLDRESTALPVVDRAGHVVGVLSEEDLLVRFGPRRRRPWWHLLADSDQLAREFRRAVGTSVAEVMTHPVITASPTLPLASAALLFDSPSIRLVPVVVDDRLVGAVSRHDLLRGLVREPAEQVRRSDADLGTEMQERMAQEAWIQTLRPAASACDGLLVLWGLVATKAQKAALETMARAIPGCRGVESHLVVAEGTRLAGRY
jgi:CBS-domain-containing membrane protein